MSTARHADTRQLTVFVHDGHPGGAGFAERGFETAPDWLRATRETIVACELRGRVSLLHPVAQVRQPELAVGQGRALPLCWARCWRGALTSSLRACSSSDSILILLGALAIVAAIGTVEGSEVELLGTDIGATALFFAGLAAGVAILWGWSLAKYGVKACPASPPGEQELTELSEKLDRVEAERRNDPDDEDRDSPQHRL